MAFNVAKIASARASLTISLTKSLPVAGPLVLQTKLAAYHYLLSHTGTVARRVDMVRHGRLQHTFICCVVMCVAVSLSVR